MTGKEKADAIARDCQADYALFVTQWHEYDVFDIAFNDNEVRTLGLPIFILVKDNDARLATDDEMWQIMSEAK